MRAAVWHGGENLTLEECPIPTAAATEVLIQVAACGICGTDVHIIDCYAALTPLFPRLALGQHEIP